MSSRDMKFYTILRATETSHFIVTKSEEELIMYFDDNPILANEIVCIKLMVN